MAITRTQNWITFTEAGDAKSASATLGGAVSVGQLIVLCVSWQGDGTGSVTSPFTDPLGNSYSLDKAQSNTSQDKVCQIWHSVVTNAGTPTITVTLAAGAARSTFTAYAGVYSGASGTTDASPPGANGSSGVPDYGTVTPGNDNSMIIACAQGISSSATADTGFTIQLNNPVGAFGDTNFVNAEDIQTTATTRATFLTAPTSTGWAACAVVFQVSGGATQWGQQTSDQWNRIVQGGNA